ncbi:hypothetical protein [Mycolicibacterium sp. CBMA 226]|uniref:hypothetical protein n=1 Tax=Mycolicibacterium sp. CBMA 226 TaxID=2606611 RepID=UPI0012DE528E|nr:hypothetical protein [Mycolicibacterium sp. CBMA 226]MUL77101.1 hypothetical protein [Mycolicibacterium sp. CBMA 226]
MAENSHRIGQRDAVTRIRDAETLLLKLPYVGKVRIPRPEQLAYIGALAALAAFEIVEWPVAVVVAAGHLLAENQHSRAAREFGEALEEA